jgi:hypothetical protein
MMRQNFVLCVLLLVLAACSQPEPAGAPVMLEEAAPSCTSGEGDGIGGTGCAID